MTVELLNDAGEIVDSAVTSGRGSYRFRSFAETGDYQVRLVVPAGRRATTPAVRDVLISRGGLTIGGVNFGVRPATAPRGGTPGGQAAAVDALAVVDSALAGADASRGAEIADALQRRTIRRPAKRPR